VGPYLRKYLGALSLLPAVLTAADVGQDFRFGAKAGVPLTQYFVTGEVEVRGGVLAHSAATRRYTFGPSIEWRRKAGFGLEVDALYKRIGYVQTENTTVSGVTIDSAFEVNGHSFDFPILAKYRWNGSVAPYAAGGFALRYMPLGRARGVRTVRTAQSTTTTTIDTDESLPVFVPGATAAAGLEFTVSKMRLLPEFRYTRWRSSPISGALRLDPNQIEFVLGFLF
jgi:hypothetical protein